MNCHACDKPIRPRDEEHSFAGYGFYVEFHPECCPTEVDSFECDKDHPGEHPANNSGENTIPEECNEPG